MFVYVGKLGREGAITMFFGLRFICLGGVLEIKY